MAFHIWPLTLQDRIHHRITGATVAARLVMPEHAILLRAERFDGALRPEVEVVGAQADDGAAESFERVLEQDQLARRVDVRALAALRVPRPADLDAIDRGHDVVITRRADDLVV